MLFSIEAFYKDDPHRYNIRCYKVPPTVRRRCSNMVAMVGGDHVAMKVQKSIEMVSSELPSKMKTFISKKPLMAP
jgi:hypothetical protein